MAPAAAGGAAGVEDGGHVVTLACCWCLGVWVALGLLQQGAGLVFAEGEHMLRTRLLRQRDDALVVGRVQTNTAGSALPMKYSISACW